MSTNQSTAKTVQKRILLFAIAAAMLIALFSIMSKHQHLQGDLTADEETMTSEDLSDSPSAGSIAQPEDLQSPSTDETVAQPENLQDAAAADATEPDLQDFSNKGGANEPEIPKNSNSPLQDCFDACEKQFQECAGPICNYGQCIVTCNRQFNH